MKMEIFKTFGYVGIVIFIICAKGAFCDSDSYSSVTFQNFSFSTPKDTIPSESISLNQNSTWSSNTSSPNGAFKSSFGSSVTSNHDSISWHDGNFSTSKSATLMMTSSISSSSQLSLSLISSSIPQSLHSSLLSTTQPSLSSLQSLVPSSPVQPLNPSPLSSLSESLPTSLSTEPFPPSLSQSSSSSLTLESSSPRSTFSSPLSNTVPSLIPLTSSPLHSFPALPSSSSSSSLSPLFASSSKSLIITQLYSSTSKGTSIKESSGTTNLYSPAVPSSLSSAGTGWIAGPIIGGAIGLTFLFAVSYIIGKYRHQGGQQTSGFVADSMILNENPAFVSAGVEQLPAPVELRNFASYVGDLHSNGNKKFKSQYQMLIKMTPHHEKAVSELPQNRNKNRYANILPYDASRVKLTPTDADQQSMDYINASYIPGQTSQREYIAAQGPLTTTVDDFWRMVWEQNVTCIVMLTNLREDNRDKCAKYWPSKNDVYQGEFLSYGDIQVRLTSESVFSHYIVRMLQAQMGDVSRTVRQYHFLDWEDSNSPADVESLLNFTRDVRAWSNRTSPVLVHCSSGGGRTGTFILIDQMLQVVDSGGRLDLFGTVLEMRDHRVSMVQNENQFIFAHDAVKRTVEEKMFGASHQGFDGYDEMP